VVSGAQAGRAFHPDVVVRGHDLSAHRGVDRENSMTLTARQAAPPAETEIGS
jgi:hypothetical protein